MRSATNVAKLNPVQLKEEKQTACINYLEWVQDQPFVPQPTQDTQSDPELDNIKQALSEYQPPSSGTGAGASVQAYTIKKILASLLADGVNNLETTTLLIFTRWLSEQPSILLLAPLPVGHVADYALQTIICNGQVTPYANLLKLSTRSWRATDAKVLISFINQVAKSRGISFEELLTDLGYSCMMDVLLREFYHDQTLEKLTVSHLLDTVCKKVDDAACRHCLKKFSLIPSAGKITLTQHLEVFYGTNIKGPVTDEEAMYETVVQALLVALPVTPPPFLPPIVVCPWPKKLDPSTISLTILKKPTLQYYLKTSIFQDFKLVDGKYTQVNTNLPVAVYGYPGGSGGYIVTRRGSVHQGPTSGVKLDEIICLAAINNTSKCFSGVSKVDLYGGYRYTGGGCPCCEYWNSTSIAAAKTQQSGYKPLDDKYQCKYAHVEGSPFCFMHSV